ncbi:MAG: pilin [Chromatiaceae bacterium]|nr:pilin [Chromatiaceae bacterium]
MSAGKTAFETFTNDGGTVAAVTDIGLQATTGNCAIAVTGTTITCTIANAPSQVNGADVVWTRNATTGEWTCSSTITNKPKYAPKTCQG